MLATKVTHLFYVLLAVLSFRHNTVDFTLLPDHDVVLTLFPSLLASLQMNTVRVPLSCSACPARWLFTLQAAVIDHVRADCWKSSATLTHWLAGKLAALSL